MSCVLALGQHQHQSRAKGSCSQENTFSRQCTFVEGSQLRASHGKKAPSPWCTVRQLTDNYRLISRRNMALVKGIISILSFLVNTWWELQYIYDSSKRQNPPASPQLYFYFLNLIFSSFLITDCFFPSNDLGWFSRQFLRKKPGYHHLSGVQIPTWTRHLMMISLGFSWSQYCRNAAVLPTSTSCKAADCEGPYRNIYITPIHVFISHIFRNAAGFLDAPGLRTSHPRRHTRFPNCVQALCAKQRSHKLIKLFSWQAGKKRGGPGQELLLLSLFLNTWRTLSYYGGEDHIST